MKLLLDINILLDVLLQRDPWHESAARLLSIIEMKKAEGFVASHTIPTIYYIIARVQNRNVAERGVTDLLRILDVASTTKAEFEQALKFPMRDFEDAVQAAAAVSINADYIVTRNEKDFQSAPVRSADPATILALV